MTPVHDGCRVVAYRHGGEFLEGVGAHLKQNEAFNNLPLGLGERLRAMPVGEDNRPFLAGVMAGDQPALAVLMTPPYNLIITALVDDVEPALDALADYLQQAKIYLPGVLGPSREAGLFASKWAERCGLEARLHREERVYELRRVIMPRCGTGVLRPARQEDLDVLAAWMNEFNVEALGVNDAEEAYRTTVLRLPDLFVWEVKGRVVSMAGKTRPTAHSVTISMVYTPPELRGHGYASACVAQLSQALLDGGRQFITLFTDLANPTSNKIYQAIGYQPLGDYLEYHFGEER